MKTLAATLILAATLAHAAPTVDAEGNYHADAPTRYEGQGVAGAVTPEWLISNAGWRYATEAEIAAQALVAQEAAQAAEAARISGKPEALKRAENEFLLALYGYNAAFSFGLTPADSFQTAMDKLREATAGERIDRVEAGLVLRTLWDVVLFHGGKWEDVQMHPEVEE